MKILTQEGIYYNNGRYEVMTKILMVIYKTLKSQQQQEVQQIIREQRVYHLLVKALCICRQFLIIMVQMFFL